MDARHVNGTAGLPREGEPVEFVLDGREVALNGTYVEHIFRSRYSGYAIERVRSWRSVGVDMQSVRDNSSANSRDAEVDRA